MIHIVNDIEMNIVLLITEWLGKNYPLTLVRIRYFVRFHKFLNLKKPRTLNEKILWSSFCTDTSLWSKCADKFEVRQYLESRGLKQYLFPLIGIFEKPEDIEWETLPKDFVIKTTHGCSDIQFINDKQKADFNSIKEYFSKKLSNRYGYREGSTHYPRIIPRLLIEPIMKNDEESKKYSSSIIDYKFWCFNGEPYYCFTCCNRNKHDLDIMIYDMDWKEHPEYLVFNNHYHHGTLIPKPNNYDEMIQICKILSKDFPILRCDLYNIGGRIYFGEMTFTSLGGLMNYFTDEFQRKTGDIINLGIDK